LEAGDAHVVPHKHVDSRQSFSNATRSIQHAMISWQSYLFLVLDLLDPDGLLLKHGMGNSFGVTKN
jgi:hypothetical protein